MAENFNKGGRPPVANKCCNCVKVRFDDLEFDKLIRMMELAGESVKATFIKGLVFGKTFKVHKIDKTMLDYLTKLSALFAEYRNIGVNYNIVVRELKAGFSEKKAMTLLYRLEKETKNLAAVTAKVLALTEDMRNQWSQKISVGSSLYGALSYNGEKINKEEGRVLCTNKIYVPPDGKIGISEMVEDFKNYMPKTGRTKKPVLHISLNPHPDDVLSDSDLANIAREYLDKLGFCQQPYIIYKHTDIERHHIHIVTVNVDEQGKRLNMDFIHRRSKKATTEIEEKYNLRKAERQRMDPGTPLRKVDYNAGDVKRQVANNVKLIMSRYSFRTMGEYNAVLSLYGLTSEETNGIVNGREYHGIVYAVLDESGRKIGNPFKASRLGKFASLNAVHEKLNRSGQKITHETVAKTRKRVAQALNESHSKEEFIAALKERNIDLVLRYTEDGRIYGATFIDHDSHTVLNGSRLGRECAANALNERFPRENEVSRTPDIVETANPDNETNQSQEQQTSSNSASTQQHQDNGNDYDYSLPGLNLFQLSPTVDADEEDFKRRMKRKKKRGQRPKF